MFLLCLVIPFNAISEQRTICVKNRVKVKSSLTFSMKKAVTLVAGTTCPAKYTALLDTESVLDDVPAAGALDGTYPNPAIADGTLTREHFSSLPGVRVEASIGQAIANAVNVNINFDTEVIDTDGFFPGAGTTVTIPFDGRYIVTAHVLWVANAVGNRQLTVIDQTNAARIVDIDSGIGAGIYAHNASSILQLSAGDTLRLAVSQNSGAGLNTQPNAGSGAASLAATWVGP